ncbi:MAG: hypothetical protein QG655_2174 [Actinomycetota bacterium]|jgi:hypothetical protein|nr:hypothetical protein [Actinomycetota bacterium]HPY24164.1 DUF2631 domain-containing protein [Mycobacterium sp.]
MANTEVERYTDVDPADVPSADWGWSKITHRTWYALGIFVMLFLLGMLHGNHVGHVEDIWLIGFAALVAFAMIRDWVLRRRGFLR